MVRPQSGSTIPRHPTRREVAIGLATAAGMADAPSWSRAPPPTIADAARRAGLRFGSAVQAATLDDAASRALLLAEVETLTPELEMKWAVLAPAANRRDYARADRIAAFARAGGKRLRGHTLLWHRSVPDWAARDLAGGGSWDIVAAHIAATVERYAPLVDEWDVVNEPIEIGGRADGLRDTVFLAAFGRDYIARALHAAHAVAPGVRLYLNDYDLDYDRPDQQARRTALLALARSLVERGVPLHGIGIQAHLDLAKGALSRGALQDFVGAIGAMGLRVSITELDVKERDYILPAAERDRHVADHVAAYLDAVLPATAVGSVTCWGLSDRQSWLRVTPEDLARFPGAWRDGSSPGLNRGLPFDADGHAKPMQAVLLAAFAGRQR